MSESNIFYYVITIYICSRFLDNYIRLYRLHLRCSWMKFQFHTAYTNLVYIDISHKGSIFTTDRFSISCIDINIDLADTRRRWVFSRSLYKPAHDLWSTSEQQLGSRIESQTRWGQLSGPQPLLLSGCVYRVHESGRQQTRYVESSHIHWLFGVGILKRRFILFQSAFTLLRRFDQTKHPPSQGR